MFVIIYGFYNTTQKLRIGNIVNNSLWLIYNVVTGLYIVSISRLITVIVNIVSYIKNKNKKIVGIVQWTERQSPKLGESLFELKVSTF